MPVSKTHVFMCVAVLWAFSSLASAGDAGQQSLPEVGIVVVKTETLRLTTELNGRAAPNLIAEVRPQVNGIILKRLFEEGSFVTENMQLYQIDPAMYQAQFDSAQASLEREMANEGLAKVKDTRYASLYQSKAVSKEDFDEVHASYQRAMADVKVAQAALEIARINLQYTQVLSPISGRIGKSSVTEGALVTNSQTEPLAAVQQLDPVFIDAAASTLVLARMRRAFDSGEIRNTGESHAKVRLILEDGSFYKHEGRLLFTDVTVEQSTGTVLVRAEFPNPDKEILTGMYVRTVVDLGERDNAILIPQQGVSRMPNGDAVVLLVGDDGTVERRKVEVARAIGNRWLITSGLNPGDKVIVEGNQRIRIIPGAPAPKATPVPAKFGGE